MISRRDLMNVALVASALPNVSEGKAGRAPTAPSYPGPATIRHRQIVANGISLHVAEQGTGPLLILVHGFPESWYSWRHQIPVLADAGFHVVALDMRGYGDSEGLPECHSYDIMHLVGDVVGLVQALGETNAVIAGHDWGATVAWHSALLRPDVFSAVVGLSVPYRQRGPKPPLRLLREAGLYTYYWLYYQDPGVADAEYERDARDSLRRTFYTFSGDAPHTESNPRILQPGKGVLDNTLEPAGPFTWLTEADLDYQAAALQRRGFRNPLNYYRNVDRNWELLAPWAGGLIRQPALFIAGSEDHVIRGPTGEQQLKAMPTTVPGLRRSLIIPNAGHYIQQERPKEVTEALVAFLGEARAEGSKNG